MIDTNEMLLIHRVLRREVGALPELIRGANNDPARARIVGPHAVEMLDFLHVHHSGEDELLWPVLRPRVAVEGDLLDRMEAQHHQVAAAIADVERDLPGWTTSADPVTGERIATRLGEMNTVLTEHLAEEEKQILPLVAANFSQAEWDALGKHGFAAVPGKRRLFVLGLILEDTDESERRTFMQKVPPPARVAYKLIGRRQWEREVATIRK
jgi:hemerythrin-like domain-containing protein